MRKRYDTQVIEGQKRQGDILLCKVDPDARLLPTNMSGGTGTASTGKHPLAAMRSTNGAIFPNGANGRAIIGLGEKTGHHHSFPDARAVNLSGPLGGDVSYPNGAPTRIDCIKDTKLEHQQHGATNVAKGESFDVRRQRGTGGGRGDTPRGYVD